MKKIMQWIGIFRKKYWEPQKPIAPKGFVDKALRILIGAIKGFMDDDCFDKASTLTFYSLLSIIPLLAIGFGIANELGFAENFSAQIERQFQNQPEIAAKIIEFSNSTLKNTKGSLLATFGLVALLWTVLRMIGEIANSFNKIWKVAKEPTLWQQIKRYLPLILLFPVFLTGSNSIILIMSTKALMTFKSIEFLNVFNPAVKFIFNLLPYVISWGFLSFIYIYLPNRHVSWKAAASAGMMTGVVFVVWQWIYVLFQTHASSYGAIYGGFAAFPLFLIWLNYSWLIILFGTELSCRFQELNHWK